MTNISKEKISSNVLAEVLIGEFVKKEDNNAHFKLESRWESSLSFDDGVVLYKLALVLLALLNIEEKNPDFKYVREHFEKLIFSRDIVEGMPFFLQVKTAMNKLGDLLKFRDNPSEWMFWARSWLREVGLDENNPASLFLFAMMWVDNYTTIMNYLKGYDPAVI